jgi:hypothetical protein
MSPPRSNVCWGRPVAPKPRPEKENHMSANKKPVAAEPTAVRPTKPRKAARRPLRAPSNGAKLVCRYCGSDDLAASFKRRRDARCRACFMKRYGSAARKKEITRTRNAKAVK